MSNPILTSEQAAAYCGIAVQTLYNTLSNGDGPKCHKRGRLNAFYESDLDDWNALRLAR